MTDPAFGATEWIKGRQLQAALFFFFFFFRVSDALYRKRHCAVLVLSELLLAYLGHSGRREVITNIRSVPLIQIAHKPSSTLTCPQFKIL